jgi:hypothetical protein
MPPYVYLRALLVLHMLGMALWFAAALTITSDIRRTIARGKPHTDVLEVRVTRSLNVSAVGALVTIASGLGLIFVRGGFGAVSPRIHVGFTLALVTLAIEVFLLRDKLTKIGAALESGATRELSGMAKRISMYAGITHALKLTILILMVYGQL